MGRSIEAKRRRRGKTLENRQRNLKPRSIVLGRMLAQHYPALFAPETAVPLAVGISREIKAAVPEVPTSVLGVFLQWWTHRPIYLQALANPGAGRMHLDGCVQAPVSDDERTHAREQLANRAKRRHRAVAAEAPAV